MSLSERSQFFSDMISKSLRATPLTNKSVPVSSEIVPSSGFDKEFGVGAEGDGSAYEHDDHEHDHTDDEHEIGGAYISSRRGMRKHPVSGEQRMHQGVDVGGVKVGTPVYSVYDAKVAASRLAQGAGNMVVLRTMHEGDPHDIVYMHLNSRNVSVGDDVRAGDKVGEVGSTGTSTAPHLHMEYKVGGVHQEVTTQHLQAALRMHVSSDKNNRV